MRYIGDIHGDFETYSKIIQDCNESIQVGDFGIGFGLEPVVKDGHKFIRGNHDNLAECKKLTTWVPDGYYDEHLDTFFVGGAYSIDQHSRIENLNWWADEELSTDEMYKILDKYEQIKPSVVVSHDCPSDVYKVMINSYHVHTSSKTSQFLGSMLYIHKPELWVFGHHHKTACFSWQGTQFICVDRCSFIDV